MVKKLLKKNSDETIKTQTLTKKFNSKSDKAQNSNSDNTKF